MQSQQAGGFVMDPKLGKVIICPYNKSHRVRDGSFWKHLLKCRRNFQVSCVLARKPVPTWTCRYNHIHQVAAPELTFHEANCEDRFKIRSYQLNVAPLREHFQHSWMTQYDLTKLKKEDTELLQMYGGLHIDSVVGGDFYGEPQKINELLKTSPEEDQEKIFKLRAKHSPMWKAICEMKGKVGKGAIPEATEGAAGGEETEGACGTFENPKQDGDKSESDEDWGKDCNDRPTFDYRKNLWDPNRRLSMMPIHLSKQEQKLFLKIHGKKLEAAWKKPAETQKQTPVESLSDSEWEALPYRPRWKGDRYPEPRFGEEELQSESD